MPVGGPRPPGGADLAGLDGDRDHGRPGGARLASEGDGGSGPTGGASRAGLVPSGKAAREHGRPGGAAARCSPSGGASVAGFPSPRGTGDRNSRSPGENG